MKVFGWVIFFTLTILAILLFGAFLEIKIFTSFSFYSKPISYATAYIVGLVIIYSIDTKNFIKFFKNIDVAPLIITFSTAIVFIVITRFDKYLIQGRLFNHIPELGRGIASLLVYPIFEELFYRGLFLNKIVVLSKNKIFAVIITSLIFTLGHFTNFQGLFTIRILSLFLMGTILSILMLRYRNLYYPIIFHTICNFFAITCI